jgi:integrase/recombinase XerD
VNKNPEYSFTAEIQARLKGFKTYLEKQGNDKSTICQKLNYTGYFLKWLDKERLQEAETTYNDLMEFINWCKLESKSKRHINTIIRSVRNYYDYLKTNQAEIINPAANLHLKGIRHKLPHDILSAETMEEIYNAYPVIDNRTQRNKIMLGMFIYQGITTGELKKLQAMHVKLQSGKIFIPGSRHSNSRTLELRSFQVLDLHEYINQIRSEFLTRPVDQLFISAEGNTNLKNSVHHLFRAIKRINPAIKSAKQIRASVITHWLKTHNLRQVQYMAGHRYVSSTERYQLNDLEGLKDQVDKYHPLGKT